MNRFAQAMVVARRDFISIVYTPTFLLFLLAPLLMVGFGAVGGLSAAQMAQSADAREVVGVLVPDAERAAFLGADQRQRALSGALDQRPPRLVAVADAAALAALRTSPETLALLDGSAAAPRIYERNAGGSSGRYLALLAETVAREGVATASNAQPLSRARFITLPSAGPNQSTQSGLGYGAVFGIFLLTLLLAGQTVGMLAEEKGNKVIEILAAAVPLEAVFFGKLVGMLGVALLFVAFWGGLVGLLGFAALGQMGGQAAVLATLHPAIGWPLFLGLGLVYFLSAFLLLGTAFLGVGAQASTVREIQMLSLPITFFQIGMFVLASAAANLPGTGVATIAQWLPWSSPFAMAARGATDPALWPHVLALGWQALWIALSIRVAVRFFRAGVLKTGAPFGWRRRKRAVPTPG